MYGFSSFSEAPFSSLALNDYRLECNAGAYTLTGGNASFSYVRTVTANAGAYSITGNASAFLYDKAIHGQAGSYSVTGGNASFDYDQVLRAEAGSFVITGNSASFASGKSLIAGTFSFALTGQPAKLVKAYTLNAQAGSYAFTGNIANFAKGKMLNAQAGNYVFSGKDATLDYQPIVSFVETKGGIDKKRKTKADREKEQREELEAIVKREFDILDGTYVPEAVKAVKQSILPQINQIDWAEYQIALAQVNALLLQAKIRVAEYESELDDEEALLMLL